LLFFHAQDANQPFAIERLVACALIVEQETYFLRTKRTVFIKIGLSFNIFVQKACIGIDV
jgi:hypothetical protein